MTTAPVRARLLAVLASTAAIGLFAWLVAPSPAEPTPEPAAANQTAGPEYSIFARANSRSDAATRWAPPADSRIGARLAEGRVIHRDAVRTVVAAPAAKAPCLLTRFADGSQGTACGLAPDEHPVMAGYSGAIGLVPDDVRSVTFTTTDGSVQDLPVEGNTWKSPVEAAKVSYSSEDRPFEVQLMPRSSLPAGASIGPTGVVSGGTP